MNNQHFGYCTNVHAGANCEQIRENLKQYSLPVKKRVSPNEPMGIGLWFSAAAAEQIWATDGVAEFGDWLQGCGLYPFTFNAFPYGDFHQDVVKHLVYQPTWAETSRLDYTLNVAKLQAQLLPENEFGTISTLPLGWPTSLTAGFSESCAENLVRCAVGLDRIRQETGRHLFLCIEPEPGCIFDTCDDLIGFFNEQLLNKFADSEDIIRNHLGVCHDVCHSAVMFEPQAVALAEYAANGIHVGKFQISSAIEADFRDSDEQHKQTLIASLAEFAEDRYLHQTSVCDDDGQQTFFEDLPLAIAKFGESPSGRWRVHFHVPIFAKQVAALSTTRPQITECLAAIQQSTLPVHYEVETYAWTVVPEEVRPKSLVDGLVGELEYFRSLFVD